MTGKWSWSALAGLLPLAAGAQFGAVPVIEIGPNLAANQASAEHTALSNANEAVMIDHLTRIRDELEGVYGHGTRGMSDAAKGDRRWDEGLWVGNTTAYRAGGGGSGEFRRTIGRDLGRYPLYRREQYLPRYPQQRNAVYAQDLEDTAGALAATAQASYERVRVRTGEIEALSERIEQTDDQKEISDLNARVNVQVGLALYEIARVLSAQAQGKAMELRGFSESAKNFGDVMRPEATTPGPPPSPPTFPPVAPPGATRR